MVANIATLRFMEPARSIVTKLGGPSAVAEAIGIHRTRVSNWQRSRAQGGTGGIIPQRHHLALMDLAEAKGVALSADDFLPLRDPPPAPQEASAA